MYCYFCINIKKLKNDISSLKIKNLKIIHKTYKKDHPTLPHHISQSTTQNPKLKTSKVEIFHHFYQSHNNLPKYLYNHKIKDS